MLLLCIVVDRCPSVAHYSSAIKSCQCTLTYTHLISSSHQPSEFEEKAIKKVDDLLESYMGIRDPELGELWPNLTFPYPIISLSIQQHCSFICSFLYLSSYIVRSSVHSFIIHQHRSVIHPFIYPYTNMVPHLFFHLHLASSVPSSFSHPVSLT